MTRMVGDGSSPAWTYPRLLQNCISFVQLSNELPLIGVIPGLYTMRSEST